MCRKVCPPDLAFSQKSACTASRILLVLDASRADRWHHLGAYSDWFWGVLHLPRSAEDEDRCEELDVACLTSRELPHPCFKSRHSSCSTCMEGRTLWGDGLRVFEPHVRVAHAMHWLRSGSNHLLRGRIQPRWLTMLEARAACPARDVSGVLYAHMDFWVLPFAFAAELPRSRIWLLRGVVTAGRQPGGCKTASEVVDPKGWWCDANVSGWAAMRSVERAGLLPASWRAQMLCPGWSDMFYVPLALATGYAALARIFWSHHVPNEIATHTILKLLADNNDVPRHFVSRDDTARGDGDIFLGRENAKKQRALHPSSPAGILCVPIDRVLSDGERQQGPHLDGERLLWTPARWTRWARYIPTPTYGTRSSSGVLGGSV